MRSFLVCRLAWVPAAVLVGTFLASDLGTTNRAGAGQESPAPDDTGGLVIDFPEALSTLQTAFTHMGLTARLGWVTIKLGVSQTLDFTRGCAVWFARACLSARAEKHPGEQAELAAREPDVKKPGAKAIAKPAEKSPDRLADDAAEAAERKAASKLRAAKGLIEDRKPQRARELCEEIRKLYPNTQAAQDAQDLLDSLEKAP